MNRKIPLDEIEFCQAKQKMTLRSDNSTIQAIISRISAARWHLEIDTQGNPIRAKSNLQNPIQQIYIGIYFAPIHAGDRSCVTAGRAFA